MISERLLSRVEYAQQLQRFGCNLVDQLNPANAPDRYNGWAYFKTAWGHHFLVPGIGPDARCPQFILETILNELTTLAPKA